MIRDPEKEPARWSEPIVASSLKAAQVECQKRAEQYDLDVESITEPRKIKNRPQLYECNFKEKD